MIAAQDLDMCPSIIAVFPKPEISGIASVEIAEVNPEATGFEASASYETGFAIGDLATEGELLQETARTVRGAVGAPEAGQNQTGAAAGGGRQME